MTDLETSIPLRILLVGENCALLEELEMLLTGMGYGVVGSVGYQNGVIPMALALRPDLVVLSAEPSEPESLKISAHLHCERIAPVILVASEFPADFVRRAASFGIYSFLVKPLREVTLRPIIEVARGRWLTETDAEDRLQILREKNETQELIEKAKSLLMASGEMSEPEAHRFLQKRSMNQRVSLKRTASDLIRTYQELHQQWLTSRASFSNRREVPSPEL